MPFRLALLLTLVFCLSCSRTERRTFEISWTREGSSSVRLTFVRAPTHSMVLESPGLGDRLAATKNSIATIDLIIYRSFPQGAVKFFTIEAVNGMPVEQGNQSRMEHRPLAERELGPF